MNVGTMMACHDVSGAKKLVRLLLLFIFLHPSKADGHYRWPSKWPEQRMSLHRSAMVQEVSVPSGNVVLHFVASWCDASTQMVAVLEQLKADATTGLSLIQVEAEEQPEVSDKYGVSAIPYFVFLKDGEVVDRLQGANAEELAKKTTKLVGVMVANEKHEDIKKPEHATKTILTDGLKERLTKLINFESLLLFMKGSPEEPQCGFSRNVVDILKQEGVEFGSFNILTDEDVRQGLKEYSNWPTYPQLYCKGELLGGCDVVIEMHKTGELKQVLIENGLLKAAPSVEQDKVEKEPLLSEELKTRLKNIINSQPLMVFMKGTPEEPQCGFSRKVVDVLKEQGVEYGSFDILLDDEVRQGLKEYSNWPTYPQLYCKGELLGGCDVVLEMHQTGDLKELLVENNLVPAEDTLNARLERLIHSEPVMLFMKGNADAPKCGFSRKVVDALKEEGVKFGSFDILSDEDVRQGIKTYSNWPTFPQLYIKGELRGGCDIVLEMLKTKELQGVLVGKGLQS